MTVAMIFSTSCIVSHFLAGGDMGVPMSWMLFWFWMLQDKLTSSGVTVHYGNCSAWST
jgi:hypothetical protein